MNAPPSLDPNTPWALFVDVDVLLDTGMPSTSSTAAPIPLLAMLGALYERLSGALILFSSHSVAEIDALFYPLRAPCVGLHGLERRDAQGSEHRPRTDPRLAHVRPYLVEYGAAHPGMFLQDCGAALVYRYENAPRCERFARHALEQALRLLGDGYQLRVSRGASELLPVTVSKARAVRAFLNERPCRARVPVYVGDEHTDELVFSYARRSGGFGVRVGTTVDSPAAFSLASVRASLEWLGTLFQSPALSSPVPRRFQ
jgi:trehalose 6-phosphate phosphatase